MLLIHNILLRHCPPTLFQPLPVPPLSTPTLSNCAISSVNVHSCNVSPLTLTLSVTPTLLTLTVLRYIISRAHLTKVLSRCFQQLIYIPGVFIRSQTQVVSHILHVLWRYIVVKFHNYCCGKMQILLPQINDKYCPQIFTLNNIGRYWEILIL